MTPAAAAMSAPQPSMIPTSVTWSSFAAKAGTSSPASQTWLWNA